MVSSYIRPFSQPLSFVTVVIISALRYSLCQVKSLSGKVFVRYSLCQVKSLSGKVFVR